jgi:diketogulonate reductase-like aldo/keto reductase
MLSAQLGETGVSIAEVGLGTYAYHGGPTLLRKGIEMGARFIDTAESYGTEAVVGEAIAGVRNRVFVATKVSPENFHAAALRRSVDSSLRTIRIDTIDLLQLHHPNPKIPIEETMATMAELVDAGKVRFIGVSNFSVQQLQDAQKALGRHRIVSNQVRYNLIDRTIESGLLQYCQRENILIIAYSPLSKDLGRIRECDPSGVIAGLARDLRKSEAQIVLNWCLCRGGVVVIPKSSSEEHLVDNCGASDWRLTEEQQKLLSTRIKYRHRNRIDVLIRACMPNSLQRVAVQVVNHLPSGLRRRIR